MAHPLVRKADGSEQLFDPAKMEHSLERAGASSTMRARILARIEHELHPGITTEEIYRKAFTLLTKEEARPIAARYSMKRALFALGPSGFPFEQFLAEVLQGHGWRTQTDLMLMGRCAPHEVDVLAEKGGVRVGIEVKFHNEPGGKTDIKDALYVHARYEDLKRAPTQSARVHEGWLVTNTVFTRNAVRYGRCSGLKLVSWDYPRGRGLMTLIEEARVHPLTCLTTLSEAEKRRFLDHKIVLCKDIQNEHLLREYGIQPSRISEIRKEAQELCGSHMAS